MSKDVAEIINMTEERFKQVAPQSISYEAEKGFAMQILMNNGYLMKVAEENKASLAQAITNVAAIGLSLNPAEKQAYLIPRSVKEGNRWVSKVFLEPSYMGLCKLATDTGAVAWVQANVVYSEDEFIDHGMGERPTHSYKAFSKERGELVGVYCVAKTHGGDYLTTLMPKDEIDSIMMRSEGHKAYLDNKVKSSVWLTDYNEQAKKSVVRRAYKMWPRSKGDERLAQAIHLSNENEGFEPIQTSPEIRDFTAEQKAYFDQLIEQDDSFALFIFTQQIESGVYASLYNSFEKGSIGKYKAIVTQMCERGRQTYRDYLENINDLAARGDEDGAIQLFSELPEDAISIMEPALNNEAQAIRGRLSEGD